MSFLQFDDAGPLVQVAVVAEPCFLTVGQGYSLMDSDEVVDMVMAHKGAHDILHFDDGSQKSGIYFRGANLFLRHSGEILSCRHFGVFRQGDMEEGQCGKGISVVTGRVVTALFPVPGDLVEFDPVVIAGCGIGGIGLGVEEIKECGRKGLSRDRGDGFGERG